MAEDEMKQKKSNREKLKDVMEKKKKIRDEEKALRDELNKNKDVRKKARHDCAKSKTKLFDDRTNLAEAMKKINSVMLAKSIKKNLDEFKDAIDQLYETSADFLESSNNYVEKLEELENYD